MISRNSYYIIFWKSWRGYLIDLVDYFAKSNSVYYIRPMLFSDWDQKYSKYQKLILKNFQSIYLSNFLLLYTYHCHKKTKKRVLQEKGSLAITLRSRFGTSFCCLLVSFSSSMNMFFMPWCPHGMCFLFHRMEEVKVGIKYKLKKGFRSIFFPEIYVLGNSHELMHEGLRPAALNRGIWSHPVLVHYGNFWLMEYAQLSYFPYYWCNFHLWNSGS